MNTETSEEQEQQAPSLSAYRRAAIEERRRYEAGRKRARAKAKAQRKARKQSRR